MLEQFWQGALSYHNFVTFNGREFDIPFLMIRSAIHKIKPTKNLLSNRYLSSQFVNAKHIDLCDQLSFYGAVWKKSSLHLACRAFGIVSPKAGGVSGDDVGALFKEKKFVDIAKYNVGDLVATNELYGYWNTYLNI
jgi:predicted PolB exonuclease-like 3'-5' exonuclease